MRRWLSRMAWGCAIGLMGTTLPAEPAAGRGPQRVLQEVRQIVHEDFYARSALGPFKEAEKRLPALAGSAATAAPTSTLEISRTIAALLESLKCSHTARYTPDQLDYYELMDIFSATLAVQIKGLFPARGSVTYPGIGIAARSMDTRWYAAYIYDGSPADQAGLRIGDELVSVGGQAFTPVLAFADRVGEDVEVRVRRHANGATLAHSVPVRSIQPSEMLQAAIRNSVRVFERDRHRLGYLRMWTFASEGIRSLIQELLSSEPLQKAEGLVLDLRGRWGGAPPDAGEMFIGRTPNMSLVGADGNQVHVNVRWRKPLVAIIDRGTRSGMEVLAYALRQAGVPLIGENTAGAVLGGRPYVLSDGSLLLLAVMDVVVDGKHLEGVGVAPTVELPFDIRYAAGRDPQLERALAELARQLPRRAATQRPSKP